MLNYFTLLGPFVLALSRKMAQADRRVCEQEQRRMTTVKGMASARWRRRLALTSLQILCYGGYWVTSHPSSEVQAFCCQ